MWQLPQPAEAKTALPLGFAAPPPWAVVVVPPPGAALARAAVTPQWAFPEHFAM